MQTVNEKLLGNLPKMPSDKPPGIVSDSENGQLISCVLAISKASVEGRVVLSGAEKEFMTRIWKDRKKTDGSGHNYIAADARQIHSIHGRIKCEKKTEGQP